MCKFQKFPEIERFHTVYKGSQLYPAYTPAILHYRGKIKLHGTNAAVLISDEGEVKAQKRTGIITPMADNFGFADWVDRTKYIWEQVSFKELQDYYPSTINQVAVCGEWYGPGIQKSVACSKIGEKGWSKGFAVFAIIINDTTMIVDPAIIQDVLPMALLQSNNVGDVMVDVLYWQTGTYEFKMFNEDNIKQQVDDINKHVDEIDKEDPYIKNVFGVTGTGEGLVFYPIADRGTVNDTLRDFTLLPIEFFSKWGFKAKGESHDVTKSSEGRKAVELSPEEIKTQNAFVEMFVTENRMLQMVERYCDNKFDIKQTGLFLKSICQDVYKESITERQSNNIEWESVSKSVQKTASQWFIKKCKEI